MGSQIEGVKIVPLKIIEDERGAVMHMLRSDSPLFDGFGEVYFSQVNPGVVKGWKRHSRMTQRYAVPVGQIKVVICDKREESGTKGEIVEYRLGRPDAYNLLLIPPGVWYGFKGVSNAPAIVVNCTDLPHDPEESEQKDINDEHITYRW